MKKINYFLFGFLLFVLACKPASQNEKTTLGIEVPVKKRIANAVIYEVNIRQITPEGTFNAFTSEHILRLKKLGVDILWLMPIHPISEKNRKGILGSYYSVADYKKVNPEFGNLNDLKKLVSTAHDMGMYVIIDWVANHTGWDNPWISEHPDWYTHNDQGEIVCPVEDWTDVADLNFDNPDMRNAMIDAMKYWVTETNIDGYRCDAAAMVPVDFWQDAFVSLDSIKPLFMLAEAWEPELLEKAFDAAYGWEFHHIMNKIAKGELNVLAIDNYLVRYDSLYDDDDILMNFITNHDENSWSGTAYERMGNAVKTFAVLTYVMPGMPLIYSGQEAALKKRLKFFEKDDIAWNDTSLYTFYRKLNELKHQNIALNAGINGGDMIRLKTGNTHIFAFFREKNEERILAVFNLSGQTVKTNLEIGQGSGRFTDVFTGKKYTIGTGTKIILNPWEYLVLQ